jgi:hypothetical protein
MTQTSFLLHVVSLLCWAIWFGGFTFYSAVVLPILHDTMGGLAAGSVTQQVSHVMNLSGAITLIAWWLDLLWIPASRKLHQAGLFLLTVSSVILIFLAYQHTILDAQLDSGDFRHFYYQHKIYLLVSTLQWCINLAALPILLMRVRQNVSSNLIPPVPERPSL